jgi:oligoendopeptidase F
MNKEVMIVDFDKLPFYQKRSFVPASANLRDKAEIISLFQKLADRVISNKKGLEQWLLDRAELDAALDQTQAVLYIRMTCQTDDVQVANAYTNFVEEISPSLKSWDDRLNKKYLTEQVRFPLSQTCYEVYDRAVRTDEELFRPDNVPLLTEVELLSQEYQTIAGAMTVSFRGKEYTLPAMGRFLQEPDRDLREAAWRATSERRLKAREPLEKLFAQMLKLRHKIATNAGYTNFADYQFRAYHRFDYTPVDCQKFHQAMQDLVVPIWKKIIARREKEMNVDRVRPWDKDVDPQNRPPLKPFIQVTKLVKGVTKIFDRVDNSFGVQFSQMAKVGLLDLASRKGKAPGGYQNTLAEARQPFIFMNAVGIDYDVRTLLHEGGHSFHALAAADQPLHDYRHAPLEFCEVASMSMELLGGEFLPVFYNDEDCARSRRVHLEQVINVLIWVATIDAFQQWIYAHPEQTLEERTQAWVDVYRRFGGEFVDWSGLEEFKASLWHRQLHIFEVPFYYIEYGIAQLGALQIWNHARRDWPGTLAKFKKAMALGGSRPLPELFAAAGLEFDFSEKTIAPLVDMVKKKSGL